MKRLLFLISILISFYSSNSQDLQIPLSIVTSAGGTTNGNSINISMWRLGEVHMVTLDIEEPDQLNSEVKVYPNPVVNELNVEFNVEKEGKYRFEITSISGRKIQVKESMKIVPGEVVKLDVSALVSGIYLLSIIPFDEGKLMVSKFSKQQN